MPSKIQHQGTVPKELAHDRLDHVVAALFPQYSRSRLQAWIKSGELVVDGFPGRSKDKVAGGERIVIDALADSLTDEPEAIPLDIMFEDDLLLVINKPAGLVVHPGAGNRTGTLLNALLHHLPDLQEVPRAGIVHRLDKDTTGLMVVAKTLQCQTSLVEQLQARTVKRIYEAVVYGVTHADGQVNAPIDRDPVHRTRMKIRRDGKEAITDFSVLRRFRSHSHMQFSLQTGRTHQIRVHMQHMGMPLVGDNVYGGQYRQPAGDRQALAACLKAFSRQALHARELSFKHPGSTEQVVFQSDIPADLRALLDCLRQAELENG